jgi:hypothetical protein
MTNTKIAELYLQCVERVKVAKAAQKAQEDALIEGVLKEFQSAERLAKEVLSLRIQLRSAHMDKAPEYSWRL